MRKKGLKPIMALPLFVFGREVKWIDQQKDGTGLARGQRSCAKGLPRTLIYTERAKL
jgi:hypothetical protein